MIMDKAVDLLTNFAFFFGGVITAMGAALTAVALVIYLATELAFPHRMVRGAWLDIAGLLFMLTVCLFASIHLLEAVKF